MQIKTTYETDCDTRIYATDPGWTCGLKNDEPHIQLGIYAHLINTAEYGYGEAPEDYPILCQFNVVVHNPAINDSALESCGLDRDYFEPFENDPEAQAEAVREMLQDYGSSGVPVDSLLVYGIRGHLEKDALGALLEGLEGVKLCDSKNPFTGEPCKVPWFSSWEDAEEFCKRALKRGDTLMGLIGFALDKPVNMVGADGWSMIRAQVEGKNWNPMPNFG